MESMQKDWDRLNLTLRREGLPDLGKLPKKNIRRGADRSDVAHYFQDPGLVRLAKSLYEPISICSMAMPARRTCSEAI